MFRGLGDPHCQAWRVDRVRVVAVCPSVTDTNMVRAALQMLSPADQEACLRNLGILQPGDIAAAAGNLIRHGRPGEVVSVNQGRYQHIDQIVADTSVYLK